MDLAYNSKNFEVWGLNLKDPERFTIGVNYWPPKTGVYLWRMFEAADLKRDFSLLAEYGFEAARIFLMWEDFQPEIHTVSVRVLDRLVQVANAAHDQHLQILPTFFCGYLSGLNWAPEWLVESGKNRGGIPVHAGGKIIPNRLRNMFADREVRNAQKRLLHEIVNALKGHPAIWGWDLGNEITRFAPAPSNDRVRAWFEEMRNELKRWDAHLPVTVGIRPGDLEDPSALFLKEAAPFCDLLSLQALPPFPQGADSSSDPGFPVFLCLLTNWLSGKETILGSYGLPIQPPPGTLNESDRARIRNIRLSTEGEAEDFHRRALRLLGKCGIAAAFVSSFADIDSTLWEKPPYKERVSERFYGLFRWNGEPKPAAKLFSESSRRRTPGEPDWTWIDMDPKDYAENPPRNLKHLYGKFRDWAGE